MGSTKAWLIVLTMVWMIPYIFVLVACLKIPAVWLHFLETAGFSELLVLDRLFWILWTSGAILALAIALCCVLMVWPWTKAAKRVVIATSVAMFALSWFIFSFTYFGNCLTKSTAASLTSQVDAVANYNHGVCVAWCQSYDPEYSMKEMKELVASGACPVGGDPIYDHMMFDLWPSHKLWCQQALEKGMGNATQSYDGEMPFDKLKNAACGCLWLLHPWDMRLLAALLTAMVFSLTFPFLPLCCMVLAAQPSEQQADEDLTAWTDKEPLAASLIVRHESGQELFSP